MRRPRLHDAAILAGYELIAVWRKADADELSRAKIRLLDRMPRRSFAYEFQALRVGSSQKFTVCGKRQAVSCARVEPIKKLPGNLNVSGTFTGSIPAGSANYVQNTTSQQASSN